MNLGAAGDPLGSECPRADGDSGVEVSACEVLTSSLRRSLLRSPDEDFVGFWVCRGKGLANTQG